MATFSQSMQPDAPAAFHATDPWARFRMSVLLAILTALLVAVWYDYRVARPAVDLVFHKITRLNYKINGTPGTDPMTSQDVMSLIGQKPERTFREGVYQIEVYSWTSGLPFRTHDYYAVYITSGNDWLFKRHYKFELPVTELRPRLFQRRTASVKPSSQEDIMQQMRLEQQMMRSMGNVPMVDAEPVATP